MPPTPSSAHFWFDPACPFTWRTSRWLVGVAEERGLAVHWHLMSLAVLNEGKEIPPEYRHEVERGRGALRLLAATQDRYPAQVGALYTALGRHRHEQDGDWDADAIAAALHAADLPAELAGATQDADLDIRVRASHNAGQARVGTESGSPITALDDGPGFFGPVVVPAPAGPEAVALLDALALLSAVPAFSELKRSRAPL